MRDSCGMAQPAIKGIYDFAISVGARTSEWFFTTEAVPEDAWITVEKMLEDETWVELPESEIPDPDTIEVDASPVVPVPEGTPEEM
jgi:hypothetical protein